MNFVGNNLEYTFYNTSIEKSCTVSYIASIASVFVQSYAAPREFRWVRSRMRLRLSVNFATLYRTL